MIKVWVLMAFMAMHDGHGGNGGPIVIDNINSLSECERLARQFQRVPHEQFNYVCTEVWKRRT